MLKTLIKKQTSELFNLCFRVGRKKKQSNNGQKPAIVLVAIVALLTMFAFYWMAELFGSQLYNTPNCWFFFVIFASLSIVVSVFVNMFISSAMLYKANDNLLLLSLPIHPKIILLSRMATLYFNCWVFTSIVWLPISISYFISTSATVLSIINVVILMFLLPCIALVIASILGFLVSLITMKKGIMRILGMLLLAILVCGFVFIRFNMNTGLNMISQNMDDIVSTAQSYGYVAQVIGLAATGDITAMLIVAGIALLVFAILYLIMSITFINMITSNKGSKKVAYKKKDNKQTSVGLALLKKEFLLLWGTSTYMFNCALGVPIMLIGVIAAIWQASFLKQFIPLFEAVPEFGNALPICIVAVICFVVSLNVISTPSVSVEGRKNIWILQSLPIDGYQSLNAKVSLHIIINVIPATILAVVAGIIFEVTPLKIFLICILIYSYIVLTGLFGMFLSTKRADLDWYNIVVPVKQSTNILFSILFGFFLNVVICLPGVFINTYIYIPIACLIMLIFCILINKWLKNTGSKLFREL